MHKISTGKFKGRKLVPIGNAPIRPPLDKIKQAVFNIFGPLDGLIGLDLFAGSGSFGLEGLSRSAKHMSFVENHPASLAVLNKNIELLGVQEDCRIYKNSVFDIAEITTDCYDIVLIDPPYDLYKDPALVKRMTATLDSLKSKNLLADDFIGALECPRRHAENLEFKHIKIVSVRKYNKTELVILGA